MTDKTPEITLDWKTQQVLANIEKAVQKIQAAIGDSWRSQASDNGAAASIDTTGLKEAIAAAVQDAILDLRAAMTVDNQQKPELDADTLADAISRSMPPPAEPADPAPTDLEAALHGVIKKRMWNHKVVKTDAPPTEEMLDKAGVRGYEMINVVYDAANQRWITYLKKLMLV